MISFSKEQVFIVTGASSGIGEATAVLLNSLGATVVAIARNEERLLAMKSQCKHPELCHLEIKDLAEKVDELPTYVKLLKEKYGKFHGMAYCAGVSCVTPLRLLDYDTIKNTFDINYSAPLLMTKGIVDKRNNIGRGFSCVYVSSIDALISSKGQSAYSGAKAALIASMKTISKEISNFGIRINCISPSMIKTNMTYSLSDTLKQEEGDQDYPFGWGDPVDVAKMIAFLLSDNSKHISGQNYVVDSGGIY